MDLDEKVENAAEKIDETHIGLKSPENTINDLSEVELQSEIESPSIQVLSSDAESPQKLPEPCKDQSDDSEVPKITQVEESVAFASSQESLDTPTEDPVEKKSSKRDLENDSIVTDDEDESPEKKKQKLAVSLHYINIIVVTFLNIS